MAIQYGRNMLLNLMRCDDDEIYFLEQLKIQSPVKGAIPFTLFDYQKKIIKTYQENNKVILLCPRQMGKTITTALHLLYEAMFKSNQTILIVSNNLKNSLEILERIKYAYENCPDFLRAGVIHYNKRSIDFDNHSRIIVDAIHGNTTCGMAINQIYIDEMAFIQPKQLEEFWIALAPLLACGTKCIVSSTPLANEGLFYDLWTNTNENNFTPLKINCKEDEIGIICNEQ